MAIRKQISLLLATALVSSLLVIIAATMGSGKDGGPKRVRVLRRADQLHIKPRRDEIAAFQEGPRERTLKTRDFKDMPVVVRQVRNLQSDTWHKDLEIEVKNVSTKPIYGIFAYLNIPSDRKDGEAWYGITLEFGDRKNLNLHRIADQKDPHFDPGETIVLTIPEQYRKGLKVHHERYPEMMRKLELHLALISFGDGTGYEREHLRDYRVKRSHFEKKSNHRSNQLAVLASVNPPPQDGCGPCSRYMIDYSKPFQICYGNGAACDSRLATTSPDQPCTLIKPDFFDCDGDGIKECHNDEIYESTSCPGTTPTPTPTPEPSPSPSPSPSPLPSPSCDPNSPHKLNDTNCVCASVGDGTYDWFCSCEGGAAANYKGSFANTNGCDPAKSVNNGQDCCICVSQQCPDGSTPNPFTCECASPTPAPTPNNNGPGGGGPGGGGGYSCTEYWWVLYQCECGDTSCCHEVDRWYDGCY